MLWGKWVKLVKRFKLPVMKQKVLGYHVYSTVTIVSNTVLLNVAK